MEKIPCFYHPSTLVLIDNNRERLNSISTMLAPFYRSVLFHSSLAALRFIEKCQKHTPPSYLQIVYAAPKELQVEVAISPVHHQLFDSHRFDETAIVVIHSDIPDINGLELARRIKSTTPLKVILTGEVDEQTVIDALHQQQIDYFLPKNTVHFSQTLLSALRHLHTAYFYERSCGIWHNLTTQADHPFQDPDFVVFFHRTITQLQATEYYLLDESGSFLLVDTNGELTWLVVRTEEDMQMFYEIAEEECAAPGIIEALRQRKKIVCLSRPHLYAAETQAWQISNAQKLRDKKIYYCLLGGKKTCQLEQQSIRSYADFLKNKRAA